MKITMTDENILIQTKSGRMVECQHVPGWSKVIEELLAGTEIEIKDITTGQGYHEGKLEGMVRTVTE